MDLPLKLLFICTHNRCRSILSEAISNHRGAGRILAHSAGSSPVGQVHPLSIRYLQEAGIPTDGLRSQSWDEFETFGPDVVITVCDDAAKEVCPVWFGNHLQLHWGLSDPSKVEGSDADKAAAFRQTIAEIERRTDRLLGLSLETLDRPQLADELSDLVGG